MRLHRRIILLAAVALICLGRSSLTQSQGSFGDARRLGYRPIVEGAPTFTGLPLVARWEGAFDSVKLGGSFERNTRGDTRMEMYMQNRGPLVTLWSADDRVRFFLDYKRKLVRSADPPDRPLTNGWNFSIFDARWSNEYETVLGQSGRKVILTEKNGSEAGYSVISEHLNLVLREEVRIGGQIEEWRITDLTLKEPAQDVLRIPPDFTRTGR